MCTQNISVSNCTYIAYVYACVRVYCYGYGYIICYIAWFIDYHNNCLSLNNKCVECHQKKKKENNRKEKKSNNE